MTKAADESREERTAANDVPWGSVSNASARSSFSRALEAGREHNLPHGTYTHTLPSRPPHRFNNGPTNRALGDTICSDRRRLALDAVAQSCLSLKSSFIEVLVATAKVSVSARVQPLPPSGCNSNRRLTAGVVVWFVLMLLYVRRRVHFMSGRIRSPPCLLAVELVDDDMRLYLNIIRVHPTRRTWRVVPGLPQPPIVTRRR